MKKFIRGKGKTPSYLIKQLSGSTAELPKSSMALTVTPEPKAPKTSSLKNMFATREKISAQESKEFSKIMQQGEHYMAEGDLRSARSVFENLVHDIENSFPDFACSNKELSSKIYTKYAETLSCSGVKFQELAEQALERALEYHSENVSAKEKLHGIQADRFEPPFDNVRFNDKAFSDDSESGAMKIK